MTREATVHTPSMFRGRARSERLAAWRTDRRLTKWEGETPENNFVGKVECGKRTTNGTKKENTGGNCEAEGREG